MWLLVILITLQLNEEKEKRVIESQYHTFIRESECREIAKKVRRFRGRKHMKHIYAQCFFVKKRNLKMKETKKPENILCPHCGSKHMTPSKLTWHLNHECKGCEFPRAENYSMGKSS